MESSRLSVPDSKTETRYFRFLYFSYSGSRDCLSAASPLSARVNIWLTRAESADQELRKTLRPVFEKYKQQKYLVTVFESGTESLEDSVRDLLLYNKVRLRELEAKRLPAAATVESSQKVSGIDREKTFSARR